MRIYYSLSTLDPVIVSQTNATTNNHECLDYIPGSAILGALAALLYPDLDDVDSWSVFHSGEVKFGPCYPTFENQLALPAPASWHYMKGKSVITNHHFNKAAIYNQASVHFKRATETQYKQCRDGYVTASASSVSVDKAISVKTAIDRETGVAKISSLFSYSYLEPNQTFVGWIESENMHYLEKIRPLLQGQFSIGRSRNSEFGRVTISLLDDMPTQIPDVQKTHLTLWCLSDCECLNQQGLPTYAPELSSLITDVAGTLDSQRSFIRTTKVSRFNQKRQGLDTEQLLIRKGSVLVYQLSQSLTQEQLIAIEKNGLGINRQQGLGWVMVNPAWAQNDKLSDKPLFNGILIPNVSAAPQLTQPHTTLMRWVSAKKSKQQALSSNVEQAKKLCKEIGIAYRNARQYNNILHSYEAGPSSTQWRRITDELRNNNRDWKSVLFDGSHAICKASNDEFGWGITWDNGQRLLSFSEFLEQLLLKQDSHVVLTLLSQMNRYDLATYKGLKKASSELGFVLSNSQENEHQEASL
jgi:CRISPR-associated protein Csx10